MRKLTSAVLAVKVWIKSFSGHLVDFFDVAGDDVVDEFFVVRL